MTDRQHLIQDLLAHAHEAPAHCQALMRRAARELHKLGELQPVPLARCAREAVAAE